MTQMWLTLFSCSLRCPEVCRVGSSWPSRTCRRLFNNKFNCRWALSETHQQVSATRLFGTPKVLYAFLWITWILWSVVLFWDWMYLLAKSVKYSLNLSRIKPITCKIDARHYRSNLIEAIDAEAYALLANANFTCLHFKHLNLAIENRRYLKLK